MRLGKKLVICLCLFCTTAMASLGAVTYRAKELGVEAVRLPRGFRITNTGYAAGTYTPVGASAWRVFFWNGNIVTYANPYGQGDRIALWHLKDSGLAVVGCWTDERSSESNASVFTWEPLRDSTGKNAAESAQSLLVSLGLVGQIRCVGSRGQMVGTDLFYRCAYVWENGAKSVLPLLEGCQWSDAYYINDKDQVVGFCGTKGTSIAGNINYACLWENGKVRYLGTLSNYPNSVAVRISNNGDILCKAYEHEFDLPKWFIWSNGNITVPNVEPGYVVWAISDQDRFIFPEVSQAGNSRPQIRKPYSPIAMNKRGQVTGTYWVGKIKHGCVYREGKILDLAPLPDDTSSEGLSINDAGCVLGLSYKDGTPRGQEASTEYRVVIWEPVTIN